MRKKFVFIGVVVAILLTGFYIYNFNAKVSAVTSQVEEINEVTAVKGNIKISFLADGAVDLTTLKLRFPVSGKLDELYFDVGDKVNKGEIIAKLEDKEYINKIEAAKINYEQAIVKLEKTKQMYEVQLASEKSKLDSLKFQLDGIYLQYKPMLEISDVYTLAEIEAKKITYESAKAAYESAEKAYDLLVNGSLDIELDELNVRQMETSLKSAEDDLENIIVVSPVEGEVLTISQNPGETVSNSNDFAVVSDSENLSVVAEVSEFDISKIEKDMIVEMEFEALQGQIIKGSVASVNSLASTDSSGIVSYKVNITLDSAETRLKNGMSCSVSFILKQRQSVLIIPNSAVTRIDGKQVVEVKDEAGNYVSKIISTGLTDGKNVEVTEGLNEGQIIIIRSKK